MGELPKEFTSVGQFKVRGLSISRHGNTKAQLVGSLADLVADPHRSTKQVISGKYSGRRGLDWCP